MQYIAVNIKVPLDAALPENRKDFIRVVARAIECKAADIHNVEVVRRSVDARKKNDVHFVMSVTFTCEPHEFHPVAGVSVKPYKPYKAPEITDVSGISESMNAPRPIVVGAGPAGLFCALWLARAGLAPIVVERGQQVDERMQTIEAFNNGGGLNPNSNVQFGEGGAGTFSDGKLTCGKNDPHIAFVLHEFVGAGAPEDILIDAKPHIGTDELPRVVAGLRKKIQDAGGEFRFNTIFVGASEFASANTAEDTQADSCLIRAHFEDVVSGRKYSLETDSLVLAIGHSARDTIAMLHSAGFSMTCKPFAVGVRIEHPQKLINRAQYGRAAGHPALPSADYKLHMRTSADRGVYTFCMCPGGQVVAAASEAGGVCVNGMSNHARDGWNANSALLVEVHPDDFPGEDVLAGIEFQRELEHRAFDLAQENGGASYSVPAETVGDFLSGARDDVRTARLKTSVHSTYPLGAVSADLRECLPKFITDSIAEALPAFGRKLHGFDDAGALMCAVEARSSSPVRIVRNPDTLCAERNLCVYPAGEGAGYAGGIMSAATDGIRVAQAVVRKIAYRACGVDEQKAIRVLESGHPLIFQTDTVVGLGLSVRAAESPAVLYKLKGRSDEKPISWLVDSPDCIAEYGRDIPQYAYDLVQEFWPGGLTIVVNAAASVPRSFQSKTGTLGLRMPQNKDALRLISATGPLATTSANIAGSRAPKTVYQVDPRLMLEAGSVLVPAEGESAGAASTVVDCTGARPRILRVGNISEADIDACLK